MRDMATLVSCSEVSYSVLGCGEQFLLIDNFDVSPGDLLFAEVHGFAFCGVLGLSRGVPEVYCEPYTDCALTMAYAGLSFCRIMVERIAPVSGDSGDAVPWLLTLYSIPDPR